MSKRREKAQGILLSIFTSTAEGTEQPVGKTVKERRNLGVERRTIKVA